jgi:hypothetical protein
MKLGRPNMPTWVVRWAVHTDQVGIYYRPLTGPYDVADRTLKQTRDRPENNIWVDRLSLVWSTSELFNLFLIPEYTYMNWF